MSQKKKSILRQNVFEALSNWPYGMKMVIAYTAIWPPSEKGILKIGIFWLFRSSEVVFSALFSKIGRDDWRDRFLSFGLFCENSTFGRGLPTYGFVWKSIFKVPAVLCCCFLFPLLCLVDMHGSHPWGLDQKAIGDNGFWFLETLRSRLR